MVKEWASRLLSPPFVIPDEEDSAALPVLLQLRTDQDPDVREYAARTLGRFRPPAQAALAGLTRALRDDDADVRRSAAASLVEWKGEDWEVRRAASPAIRQTVTPLPSAPVPSAN